LADRKGAQEIHQVLLLLIRETEIEPLFVEFDGIGQRRGEAEPGAG
jgi:hypothetical protein